MVQLLRVTTGIAVLALLCAALVACGRTSQTAAASQPSVVTTPPAVLPAAGVVLKVPGSGSLTLVPPTGTEQAHLKLKTPADVEAALCITLPMTPTATLRHVQSTDGYGRFAGHTVWVLCYDRHPPIPWVPGGPPRSGAPEPTRTMYFTRNVFLVDANNARNMLGWMLP